MKTGDYVRTRIGEIFKFSQTMTTNKEANEFGYDGQYTYIDKKEIIKSSPNIIDLIEVGDILTIRDMLGNTTKVEVDENFKLLSGKIVSIVTHEQFKQMEYEVK